MAAKKRPTRRQPPKSSSALRVPQPLTSHALVYTEYDITDEPLDNRDIKRLPSQVQERIDDLYELAQRDPRQVIPELERLIATYPHVPTFFNYLSIAYLAAGDQEQATAMVREAYRRHSQYLFAKVNYANLCLQQGEIGKVPGIFESIGKSNGLFHGQRAPTLLSPPRYRTLPQPRVGRQTRPLWARNRPATRETVSNEPTARSRPAMRLMQPSGTRGDAGNLATPSFTVVGN
jgi:hypothetical protein